MVGFDWCRGARRKPCRFVVLPRNNDISVRSAHWRRLGLDPFDQRFKHLDGPLRAHGCLDAAVQAASYQCEDAPQDGGANVRLWQHGADSKPQPWWMFGAADCLEHSLAFRFAVVLALAVIILVVMTLAAPPRPAKDTAAPIASSDPIYRAQYLKLY